MKISLFTTAFICSISVFAGTFSSADMKNIGSENSRAEIYVLKAGERKFSISKSISKVVESHTNEYCGEADVSKNVNDIIENLEKYYQEYKLANFIKEIKDQKKIRKIIMANDGSDGDSESCSTSTLEVYSSDGETLKVYFDYND